MIRKPIPVAARCRLLWAIPVMGALTIALFGSIWVARQHMGPFAVEAPAFLGALQQFQALPTPRPAPAIAFTDGDGKPLTLADFRGRVVLLNYWATWCAPCVEEMPSLDRLQQQMGGPLFAVVAISVDREGLPVVEPFLEKLAVKHLATYVDRLGASMRAFSIRGLPTTILIDADGREIGRIEGMARWDTPAAEAFIRYYTAAP